jgi:hypothetical protein
MADEDKKPEEATPAPKTGSLEEPSASDGGAAETDPGNPADQIGNSATDKAKDDKPPKKLNPLKAFYKKVNIYLLLFIFVVIVAGAITVVSYLNSKKAPPEPGVATQEINQDTLKQLANSDATVGGSGQTLTVQGNAIISGQLLAKKDLGVAGTIVTNSVKVGVDLTVPQLTVANSSNLHDVQADTLKVASTTSMQGNLTLQKDFSVAGNTAFSGPVTANQISVTRLIMSGNASLEVPNHISFTGASPGRHINPLVLGAGGSASINGSDTSGTLNVNSGNNPTAGCFAEISFNQRFTKTPHIIIGPVGSAAGSTQFYADITATGFSICSNNAPAANKVFGYSYLITQ